MVNEYKRTKHRDFRGNLHTDGFYLCSIIYWLFNIWVFSGADALTSAASGKRVIQTVFFFSFER